MPALEFKGKQHIYAHHLTVPYRPLVTDAAKSLNSVALTPSLADPGSTSRSTGMSEIAALQALYQRPYSQRLSLDEIKALAEAL